MARATNDTRYLKYIFAALLSVVIGSQDALRASTKNSLALTWGNNIIGNTVSFEWKRQLKSNWDLGIGVGIGQLGLTYRGTTISSTSTRSVLVDMSIYQRIGTDLYADWIRKRSPGIRGFNHIGIGVATVSLFARLDKVNVTATRNFVLYGLMLDFGLLSYRAKADGFMFDLGLKTRIFIVRGPIVWMFRDGPVRFRSIWNFGTFPVPYPEITVKFGYNF